MASKQTRRSISVRGTTYALLRDFCAERDRSMSDVVEELLGKEGVADAPGGRAVWAAGPLAGGIDRAGLAARFPGLTFEVTREAAAQSRVGVSEMEWGLADTGTVVQYLYWHRRRQRHFLK